MTDEQKKIIYQIINAAANINGCAQNHLIAASIMQTCETLLKGEEK